MNAKADDSMTVSLVTETHSTLSQGSALIESLWLFGRVYDSNTDAYPDECPDATLAVAKASQAVCEQCHAAIAKVLRDVGIEVVSVEIVDD